jgi:2-amino-4-hydroxy-6-hydroxymethyldihydropteridine diphosphokinase
MRVLVGLGGNQGDAAATLAAAAVALGRRFRLLGCSSLWRTAPIGPPQPDFLNAALLLEIDCDLLRLLACAQRIEADAGRDREREQRLGPRALDIDVLLAPGLVVESPALTLPHPRLAGRRFALLPAAELAPGWIHPRVHRTVAALAASLDAAQQPCERLGPLPRERVSGGADRRSTPR